MESTGMVKPRILLVEDERAVAKDLENSLVTLGFEICGSVSSGEEAIEKAKILHPDLVLMDIILQGKMNGIEAAEAIREFGHIPVIYLTAHADENTQGNAKLTEPYGYIRKPFDEKELNITIDIALYKHRMERRLQESREGFLTILKSMRDGVITADKIGRITYMNPEGEILTGRKQEEACGKKLEEVINLQEENIAAGGNPSSLLRQEEVIACKKGIKILITGNGTNRYLEYCQSPLLGPGQNLEGTMVTLRDVTRQKGAEQNLRNNENRYRRLVEQPFFGVLVHTRGKITYVNPAGAMMLGAQSPQEIIGRSFFDFVHSSSIDTVRRRAENINKTGGIAPPIEEKMIRLDGEVIDLDVAGGVFAQDDEWAVQIVFHDVTQRKRAEEELRRGQEEAKRLAQENMIVASIGRILSSTLDPEEVYELFAAEAKKIIPFDKISINAVDLEAKTATALYVTGRPVRERDAKNSFPLKGSFTEEVIRTKKGTIFHPENEDEVNRRFPRLLPVYRSGLRSMMSVPLILKDQAIAVLVFMATPQNAYTEDHLRIGQMVGSQISGNVFNAQLFDALKKSENNLRRGGILLQKVMDTLPVGVSVADKEGKILFTNPARDSIWKTEKFKEIADLVQYKGWWTKTGEEIKTEDWPLYRAIQKREPTVNKMIDIKDFAGQKKTVIYSALPLRDSDGEMFGAIGVLQNISDLKRAEERLKRSEEHFRSLIENSSDIILTLDKRGTILYASPSSERVLKYKPESIIGTKVFQYIHSSDLPKTQEALNFVFQFPEMIKAIEARLLHADGSWRTFHIVGKSLIADNGNTRVVVNCRDLTEQKGLEIQLAQSQKLEAVGQLAAGIAHEINTPIQYVGDNTRFFQDAFKDLTPLLQKYEQLHQAIKADEAAVTLLPEIEAVYKKADPAYLLEEIPKAIQQTLEGVERVADIVRAMKEFSHPGTKEKTPIDLNRAIENTITVARNEWKYVAEMDLDLDPSLPPVLCLPGELNQVLLNMIVNAAHAIADNLENLPTGKGKITVRSRQVDPGVEIQISDTGTGIPKEIQERIFEPFFTTKPVGKGTGQGLTIAYSVIVKKHAGAIHLESEVGKGTTFYIRLPLNGQANPEKLEAGAN